MIDESQLLPRQPPDGQADMSVRLVVSGNLLIEMGAVLRCISRRFSVRRCLLLCCP